jgi:CsoR family transcriptional regulator, copper-sensing transcriptional repressor
LLSKEAYRYPGTRANQTRGKRRMYKDDEDELIARLKRIAGQVGGIRRMVEEERYCVDVVMQISAVRAALLKVGKLLLSSHLETCVSDALAKDGRERRQKIDELLRLFELQ